MVVWEGGLYSSWEMTLSTIMNDNKQSKTIKHKIPYYRSRDCYCCYDRCYGRHICLWCISIE